MDILLDRRIQTQARNYNHKLQLMYRSSLNNQDRTALLEYNNPVPDVGNVENQEGVGRYLPSWIHDAWVRAQLYFLNKCSSVFLGKFGLKMFRFAQG